MSSADDGRVVRRVGLGLGLAFVSALLLGRSKRGRAPTPERVESTTYRGFCYVIDRHEADFEATIPPQEVGPATFSDARARRLGSLADARAWVHTTIDAALSPSVRAVFLGARR